MKIWVSEDELYPDYDISLKPEYCSIECDVPEDIVWRYNKAQREYMACRKELEGLVDKGEFYRGVCESDLKS